MLGLGGGSEPRTEGRVGKGWKLQAILLGAHFDVLCSRLCITQRQTQGCALASLERCPCISLCKAKDKLWLGTHLDVCAVGNIQCLFSAGSPPSTGCPRPAPSAGKECCLA